MNKETSIGRDPHQVRLDELKEQPIILPLRWQSMFTSECKKLGYEPKILCVSDSIVQDLLLAKMGMGLAILPISSKTLLTDGDLFYKRLVAPEITTHTVVAWLKNRTLSQSAQHFLALFREMFLH